VSISIIHKILYYTIKQVVVAVTLFSVVWDCWLSVRKGIRPVKSWVMRCWHCYLSGVRCKLFPFGPADATATPVICCLIKIQIGLTFLVPAYPDCHGKEAIKQRCLFCLLLLLMSAFLL